MWRFCVLGAVARLLRAGVPDIAPGLPKGGLSGREIDRALGERVNDTYGTGVGAVGSLLLARAAADAGNCVGDVDELPSFGWFHGQVRSRICNDRLQEGRSKVSSSDMAAPAIGLGFGLFSGAGKAGAQAILGIYSKGRLARK